MSLITVIAAVLGAIGPLIKWWSDPNRRAGSAVRKMRADAEEALQSRDPKRIEAALRKALEAAGDRRATMGNQ